MLASLALPLLIAIQSRAADTGALTDQDIALLEATVRIQEKVGTTVWPGFESFRPAVLYFTDRGQILLNATTAPAEYRRYSGAVPDWSVGSWWTTERRNADGASLTADKDRRGTINRAYSSTETAGHFMYSVFLIDSPSRFHEKGASWTIEDWMSIYWHEVFHTYQDSRYRPGMITSRMTSIEPLEILLNDSSYIDSIRTEQKEISRALLTRDGVEKRKIACSRYLPKRRARHARLIDSGHGDAVASELYYEFSEGTARYVEEMMSVAAGRLTSFDSLDRGLSMENDYSRFSKFRGRTASFYQRLIGTVRTGDRYYYATGFALSLFLDQVRPGWKKDVFRASDFLEGPLEAYCTSGRPTRRS